MQGKGKQYMTDDMIAQNIAIKQRLRAKFVQEENKSLSVRQNLSILAENINHSKDRLGLVDFIGSRQLQYILDEPFAKTGTAPNIHVALVLCRYWNLSVSEVFSPPKQPPNPIAPEKLLPNADILTDENYVGVLQGFMFSRKVNHTYLIHFELEIKRGNNQTTSAIMSIKSEENRKIKGEEYIGIPVLIESENLLFIPLFYRNTVTNPNKAKQPSYYLYMDYGGHSSGIYYRKGIAITRGASNSGPNSNQLIMQNFVLFRNLLKDEAERYVRSMLPIMGDSFVISEEAMAKMAQQDKEMESFFEDYSYNWKQERNMISGCYRVSIDQVINSIKNRPNEEEDVRVIGALLRMIGMIEELKDSKDSILLPSCVSCLEPLGMTEFAKSIQYGFNTQQ